MEACPKCAAPRKGEVACPKCGLRADRMATFARRLEEDVPPAVRVAWERAEASWDDAAAHDELLRLTQLHGCYAWVVGRYRASGREGGEKRIERMRKAAELAMVSSATAVRGKEKTPYRSSMLALVLLVVLLVVGIGYAMFVRTSKTIAEPVLLDRKAR